MKTAKVIISVAGGVAFVQSISQPQDVYVEVEIRDYDNGEELPDGDPRKAYDAAGDAYQCA